MLLTVERVVILGRGASGKSTTSARLGHLTGLPVIELDKQFWSADLIPLAPNVWSAVQRELAGSGRWIMDGDLGHYDVLRPRLEAADTVVVLDLSLARCAWRAVRRSRERTDFWWSLLIWRYRSRRVVLQAVTTCADQADVHVFRSPRQLRRYLAGVAARHRHLPTT